MGSHLSQREAATALLEAGASARVVEPRSSACSVRLFVVEDGASALEAQAPPDGSSHTMVIAQCGGERPMEFAARTIRGISALEQQQQRIARAILLLSPCFDAEATAARVCLARVLRAHSLAMASAPLELLVGAGSELHESLKATVLALVDALTEPGRRGALSITVQFAPDVAPVAGRVFASH